MSGERKDQSAERTNGPSELVNQSREGGEGDPAGDPESLGVGCPLDGDSLGEADSDPDGDGDGDPDEGEGDPDEGEGDADDGEGEPEDGDGDADDGEGDPDDGDGDPEDGGGEPDEGGGDPDGGGGDPEPVGGGGVCGGAFWKIKMASSTAKAASNSINSHDTRMVRHPARS